MFSTQIIALNDHLIPPLRQVLDGVPFERVVSQFRLPEGELINVRIFGMPLSDPTGTSDGGLLVVEDLTHHAHLARQFTAAEHRYQALLQAVPDLLLLVGSDGTYLDCKVSEMGTLVPPEDFIGKNVTEIGPPGLGDRILSLIQHVIVTGELEVLVYELPFEGELRTYEARLVPNLPNEDPDDVARTAKVTASSFAAHEIFGRENVVPDELHPLNMPRAVMFPRGIHGELKSVWLLLENARNEAAEITARVRGATEAGDFSSEEDLGSAKATVPPGKQSFVEFAVNAKIDSPMVWVLLPKTEGVSWRLMTSGPYAACRAYGGANGKPWTVVKGQYYGMYTDPPLTCEIQCHPENVINGVARIVDRSPNQWVSDPAQPLPQWIELEFPETT